MPERWNQKPLADIHKMVSRTISSESVETRRRASMFHQGWLWLNIISYSENWSAEPKTIELSYQRSSSQGQLERLRIKPLHSYSLSGPPSSSGNCVMKDYIQCNVWLIFYLQLVFRVRNHMKRQDGFTMQCTLCQTLGQKASGSRHVFLSHW